MNQSELEPAKPNPSCNKNKNYLYSNNQQNETERGKFYESQKFLQSTVETFYDKSKETVRNFLSPIT